MENESHTDKNFNIENCRAENTIKHWVDCLSPKQARICGFSVSSGNGYTCEHRQRFQIVSITINLKNENISNQNEEE